MIELYQFPAAFGVPNPSPFCIKVETWLRLAELEYKIKWRFDSRKSPHGKLPFIKDNGKIVADSNNIIEHLSQAHHINLDGGLSDEQQAAALAFDRMLSEHTYWGVVFARWIEPTVWNQVRAALFAPLPPIVRSIVAALIRKKQQRTLWLHGLGRHGRDEIYRRMGQDIAALSAYLGSKPFMMGERPSNVDATVYAFLASCWEAQLDTPLKALVAEHQNLVAYCKRMRERCFGVSHKAEAQRIGIDRA